MYFLSTLFLTLIITGPVIVIAGYIVRRYPPKKMNILYGYRTRRSMQSQEAWDFAQLYATKLMIRSGWVITVLGAVSLYIPVGDLTGVIIALLIISACLIYPIIKTERALKDRFD